MMKFCPFINKYNCYEMNFPSEKDKWVKFEKNVAWKRKANMSSLYFKI